MNNLLPAMPDVCENFMRILLILTIAFFTSCKTSNISSNITNEIQQYKFENVDTLVDVGCGDAYHDRMISHSHPNLFFILEDLPYQVKYTKKKGTKNDRIFNTQKRVEQSLKNSPYSPAIESHYQLILGSADSIPLPSSSYKRILCRRTLHEFKNRQKMASELMRILSNDGLLTIVEIDPRYPGETDPYCKFAYMTKVDVSKIFPLLHLKNEGSIFYADRKLNIFNFTK